MLFSFVTRYYLDRVLFLYSDIKLKFAIFRGFLFWVYLNTTLPQNKLKQANKSQITPFRNWCYIVAGGAGGPGQVPEMVKSAKLPQKSRENGRFFDQIFALPYPWCIPRKVESRKSKSCVRVGKSKVESCLLVRVESC